MFLFRQYSYLCAFLRLISPDGSVSVSVCLVLLDQLIGSHRVAISSLRRRPLKSGQGRVVCPLSRRGTRRAARAYRHTHVGLSPASSSWSEAPAGRCCRRVRIYAVEFIAARAPDRLDDRGLQFLFRDALQYSVDCITVVIDELRRQ